MPPAVIITGGSASATGGGGGGSNPSVGPTGAPAPTSATEIGIIVAGNLVGVSASNPVPISGSITASNPSVGLTGTPAPTSATEIGVIDNTGNLVGASASNPVRVDPTGTTVQPISGTVTANIGTTGGLALDTSVNGILVAQGSTTSGEKGPLVQGAVSNAQPAYVDGQTFPLSMDTLGHLRIQGAGITGAGAPATAIEMGFVSSGNLVAASAANPLPISITTSSITLSENLTQIGGASVSTVASGVLKVGIVGHTGANLDAIIGAGGLPPNALLAGGSDGTNVRAILLDTTGVVQINIDNVGGNAASTAASGVLKVGIVGNTGATVDATLGNPHPTNAIYIGGRDAGGNIQAFFLDASSNLNVNVNAPIAAGTNIIGKIDILGTSGAILDFAGQNASGTVNALLVGGQFNTTPTTIGTGNFSPLQLDSAGNLLVNIKAGSSGNAAAGPTGSAVPASADYIGFNSGGNLVGVSSAAPLPVVGTGTAGSPGTAVLTVQGIASGTAQPVSGNVGIQANNGNTITAVIAAATAPLSGVMTLAENVTTAPSLTTGQSVAAQCDYQGSLFVKPFRRGQTKAQATTITNTSAATTVLAAAAAGIFSDISALVVTPTAQSTGVAFTITLSDGTNNYVFDMNTGSTTSLVIQPPLALDFNPPIAASTAATAWTIALSSNAVTVHIVVNAVLQKAS
jgi:hypothetical protein